MNSTIQKRIEAIQRGETPKGYKRCPIGVVPKEWRTPKAREVFIPVSNKNNNGDLEVLSVTQDKGVIPRSQVDIDIKYNEASVVGYKLVQKGNFVISLRSFQGGIEYSDYNGVVSPAYTVLENAIDICHTFYKYYFKTPDYINRLSIAVYGIRDGKQISYNDFSTISIPLPPLPEQKAIAEILTQQDRLIDLLQKLIDEKRRQKKYLMQTLLTGITRFPGFEGKWKTKTLGEIGSTYGGLTGKSSSDFGSGHPFIPYLNIYQNIIVDNNTYGYVSVLEGEKQNLVQYGDILVTTSSETPDEVGICSLYLGNQKKLFLNSFCFGFRLFNQDNINLVYLINYLRCGVVRNKLNKLAQGATRYNLSKNEFMKIQISLPSLPEQEAIAEILSTANEELSLLERELEQEKLRKKALMQLLLTGLVRIEEL